MNVHQVIHGYAQGHALLASSVDLTAEERRRINALSDLSGYLDRGQDFDRYWTGYPCGRFYVVAETRLDRDAERRGSVWTHSLLLPIAEAAALDDPLALRPHFLTLRRPIDLQRVVRPLHLEASSPAPLPSRGLAPSTDLALALLGDEASPIVWGDPDSVAPATSLAWAWLPHRLRTTWAFCTLCLQPRWIEERPLDWMGVAPGSSSAFRNLRIRTHALPSPTPAERLPWMAPLLDGTPMGPRWRHLSAQGLDPDSPGRARLALRLLCPPSGELTDTLGRLDALLAFRGASPALGEAEVAGLIRALASPEISLLELNNVVARSPQLYAPATTEALRETLFRASGRAVSRMTEGDARWLPRLLTSARVADLSAPVEQGLLEGLRRLPPASRTTAMLASVQSGEVSLCDQLLSELSGEVRAEALQRLYAAAPEAARPLVSKFADRPALARLCVNGTADPQLITPLLERALFGTREEWLQAMDRVSDPTLRRALPSQATGGPLAGAIIRRLADAPDVLTTLSTLPRWAPELVLEEASVRHRERLMSEPAQLVRLALSEQSSGLPIAMLMEAIEETPAGELVALGPPPVGKAGWCRRIAARSLPKVFGDLASGESDSAVDPWLDAAAHEVPWPEIRSEVLHRGRPRPTALLIEQAQWRALREPGLVKPLIGRWVAFSDPDSVDLKAPWASLLRRLELEHLELSLWASTASLSRAFKGGGPSWAPLAGAAFAPVHRALCRRSTVEELVGAFAALWGQDWDKAKALRKELVQVAKHKGWPPEVLVEAAQGDPLLEADLLRTAEKHWPSAYSALRGPHRP